jgi:hypothetical protein
MHHPERKVLTLLEVPIRLVLRGLIKSKVALGLNVVVNVEFCQQLERKVTFQKVESVCRAKMNELS